MFPWDGGGGRFCSCLWKSGQLQWLNWFRRAISLFGRSLRVFVFSFSKVATKKSDLFPVVCPYSSLLWQDRGKQACFSKKSFFTVVWDVRVSWINYRSYEKREKICSTSPHNNSCTKTLLKETRRYLLQVTSQILFISEQPTFIWIRAYERWHTLNVECLVFNLLV